LMLLSNASKTIASNTCSADPCKQIKADCQDIINKIATERADRDKYESALNKTIADQGTQLNTVTQDRDDAVKSKDAWYHNPFILVPAGILLGGIGVLYLEHR
jgi:hypothetical protein